MNFDKMCPNGNTLVDCFGEHERLSVIVESIKELREVINASNETFTLEDLMYMAHQIKRHGQVEVYL
jgi:hypothetical protein